MKKIAILGSTGSIGTQTLDVVRANGDIEVLGISAGRNVKNAGRAGQESFILSWLQSWDENAAKDLAVRLADTDAKVVSGMEGLLELARMPQTDILVTAVVGMIGIRPTMEGIKCGQGHCPCKQRNTGNSRSSDHSDGKRAWSSDPSGRQ